jgi:hypothetical protein
MQTTTNNINKTRVLVQKNSELRRTEHHVYVEMVTDITTQ